MHQIDLNQARQQLPELLDAAIRGEEIIINEKLVSVAALWEIAIKHSIGKLPLAAPFSALIPQQLALNGFDR